MTTKMFLLRLGFAFCAVAALLNAVACFCLEWPALAVCNLALGALNLWLLRWNIRVLADRPKR